MKSSGDFSKLLGDGETLVVSRRSFLTLLGGAIVLPSARFGESQEVPTLLDHILLGVPNLESGIAFVEGHTGVRAVFGGVHPGRGTQNALLSLGDRRYLEIIAHDPAQPDAKNPIAAEIRSLKEPRLVGWAAHPGNLSSFAEKLHAAGIAFQGPTPGSRKRPDGRLLQWQTLNLADDSDGLLPFFIEWAPDSPHPSSDAPKGCSLAKFSAETPDPPKLLATLNLLNLDLPVRKGEKSRLLATITGPQGTLELSS
jgi:Glyoxalase-like domain